MGYRNRTIRMDFDDLGDGVYVTLRNPKLVPADRLAPRQVAMDANGMPANQNDMFMATYETVANLITDWCVYDAEDESEDPAPLGAPSIENVAKMPSEMFERITNELFNRKAGGTDPS